MKIIVNEKQYKNLVLESRGYSKFVDDWSNYICDLILPLIIKQPTGEDVYLFKRLSTTLRDKEFYENFPIESIIFSVILKERDDDEVEMDMSYNPFYTQIVENEDGSVNIHDVEFEIGISLPTERDLILVDEFRYYLSSSLTHEFMHAYEWYKRNLKSPKELKTCNTIFMEGHMDGDVVSKIAFLIYVSLSYEMNAFIQQANNMVKQNEPKGNKEFMNVLKTTPIYKFVKEMVDFDINDVKTKIDELTEDRISELKKIIICYYQKENKLPKVKSVDRFLIDLKNKFNIRGNALMRKLLKIVTNI
jgi:hypothetical protein